MQTQIKIKSMDVIVKQPFQPHKPHADIMALGYLPLACSTSIKTFLDADIELETNNHEVIAVRQEQAFYFYAKPLKLKRF